MTDPPEWLTVQQVMTLLQVSSRTVYNMVAAGRFKRYAMTPRTIRFRRSEVIAAMLGSRMGDYDAAGRRRGEDDRMMG